MEIPNGISSGSFSFVNLVLANATSHTQNRCASFNNNLKMKENPKYIIPKPCNKRWNDLRKTFSSNEKFCQNCNEKVFDIRTKSKSEIEIWSKKNNKNVCVLANTSQLTQEFGKKKSIFDLRKIGIASVLIGSSLLHPNLYAQEPEKANSFTIEQTDLKSENIIIEGVVKIKALIGWKKLDEYKINIYSNEVFVTDLLIDRKGKFKLELNKKVFSEKMSISIHSLKYKSIRIDEIEVKDTMLKIYLDKKDIIVVGRFY